ncbi:MAG TPA: TldD/PmbA family protein [Gemmatimonadaceae bacterium]|jgi:TldD protein|nr:TldD/PmbA family protein [Gemmatimonadaceae bacterium]
MTSSYTRRDWLTRNTTQMAMLALAGRSTRPRSGVASRLAARPARSTDAAVQAVQAERIDPGTWQALAQTAVDVARSAGATYADARLTRTVAHQYNMEGNTTFDHAWEIVGVGVRALVDGYWGFVAAPFVEQEEIVQMARDAVGQAKANSNGPPRTVELGRVPPVTGMWETPIRIDPFNISVEEKLDFFAYWKDCAKKVDIEYVQDGESSSAQFVRQERVVATSEGSTYSQTQWESAGLISIDLTASTGGSAVGDDVPGLDMTGQGWELFLDANLPEKFLKVREMILQRAHLGAKPATIGRYTLVCDGRTMASLLQMTLGVATQLDRALGYEANASGTSFIDDPLAMVGTYQVASPLVTVTANRSETTGLATVKWDDEGVTPRDTTLVKDGVLVDFQTTREQAAWLAPYYQRHDHPVRSNGYAASFDALSHPLQMMPNLALEPSSAPLSLNDLVADVKDGLLLEDCRAYDMDFQARSGLLGLGRMREIKNGRLGSFVGGGACLFDSVDLWKHLMALGGRATQGMRGVNPWTMRDTAWNKGQPPQATSNTVRAVAATILNQPFINPTRKV